jgi:hypothetical protein
MLRIDKLDPILFCSAALRKAEARAAWHTLTPPQPSLSFTERIDKALLNIAAPHRDKQLPTLDKDRAENDDPM